MYIEWESEEMGHSNWSVHVSYHYYCDRYYEQNNLLVQLKEKHLRFIQIEAIYFSHLAKWSTYMLPTLC